MRNVPGVLRLLPYGEGQFGACAVKAVCAAFAVNVAVGAIGGIRPSGRRVRRIKARQEQRLAFRIQLHD
ncbi:hypothetical protein ACFVT2_20880 [Streptomyces sp. NPDC058000]|uniref:hypothetical protein n=1 Tax=Streptomyces sp. NPDC058000 TaxID=3346299 RepID=UPI0036E59C44